VERVDLRARRDAARGNHLPVGGGADRPHGGEIEALHHSLPVHERAQEPVAERGQGMDGLDSRQRERRAPAVDRDLTAARVDGGDDAPGTDCL
jgi:hypothetical protein